MQRDQVHRPHPGKSQPQEAQGRARGPRLAHLVDVVPGQHEATEDEEQIDALGAAVEDWCERRREIGRRLPQQRAEVEEHDPQRSDDAQTGQGPDLSAAHNTLFV